MNDNKKTNRKKSKLQHGITINGIILLLESCLERKRYFRVYIESHIYFKKLFIRYLKWCIRKNLISNSKVLGKKNTVKESWMIITPKGRLFLEDFKF